MPRCTIWRSANSNAGEYHHPATGKKPVPLFRTLPLRKAREALITRSLEHHLTKERILELYLNVAEWGQGVFGAEAAARHHFGKRRRS